MLDFLFRRLTAEPRGGTALFATATHEARQPHWYREAQIPDTLDGRFAMLSTIVAMILARLEHDGDAGNAISVALTERFIEVMECEHRELGLGDPTLGKTVRKLVGSLARRTELWRDAAAGSMGWSEAVRQSVYNDEPPAACEDYAREGLKRFWAKLEQASLEALSEGRIE